MDIRIFELHMGMNLPSYYLIFRYGELNKTWWLGASLRSLYPPQCRRIYQLITRKIYTLHAP